MTLGRGLESLIPPQPFDATKGKQPFDPSTSSGSPRAESRGDKTQSEPYQPSSQPQDDLGETSPRKQDLFRPSDNSRTEPLAGPLGSVRALKKMSAWPAEREEEVRPLESDNPSSDRGLSNGETQSTNGIVFQIETDKISPNPHQPRRNFDEESLEELARSIREFGIIQPLVVSKIERETSHGWEVSYELIAGERRLLAAKSLGLVTVPAIVRQVPVEHEKLELAVTENVQRSNLNPIEFARAMAKLQEDFKLTQREIAARLGKSREVVANTLRLLSLPSNIQEAIATGKVSESQARLLLSVDDIAAREKLFQEVLINNLTVREINQRVRRLKGKPTLEEESFSEATTAPPADPEFISLRDQLEELLGTKVELRKEGEGGKLTINFYSKEELEGILAKLKDRQTP